MKNAQGRIDTLIDLMVDTFQDHIAERGWVVMPPAEREHFEWLIKMSNLNNARQEKTGKQPGPQAKEVPEMTDAALVAELKSQRDPDLFPRRGPRNGKRENVSTPLKDVPDVVTCAIHDGVVCVRNPSFPEDTPLCPDCLKAPEATEAFVSLKSLL